MQTPAFSGLLQFLTPIIPVTNSATALISVKIPAVYNSPDESSPSLRYANAAIPAIATIPTIIAIDPKIIISIPVTLKNPEPFALFSIEKPP